MCQHAKNCGTNFRRFKKKWRFFKIFNLAYSIIIIIIIIIIIVVYYEVQIEIKLKLVHVFKQYSDNKITRYLGRQAFSRYILQITA